MTTLNEDLYQWFQAQRLRRGDRQAWELLCAALGVPPVLGPYLERYVADERAEHTQGWEEINAEWERIFQMEDALKRRGVTHVVWKCPALATKTCRMWE